MPSQIVCYWGLAIQELLLLGFFHPRLSATRVLSSQSVCLLLGLCHPRLTAAGVLPFQTVCYWSYAIPDCMLLGLCHPRLNAAGVKPSQTVSYWGFAIPELCATEAMPSQIVCLDDLLVAQYPQLSCPGINVLDVLL